MKSFKNMSRSQRILCLVASVVVGGAYSYSHQQDASINSTDNSLAGADVAQVATYTNSPAGASSSQGKVVLYDQGLQMPRGSYVLPDGWNLIQDIATDPATGQPRKNTMDITGPRGELIRALGVIQYSPMMGTEFEQSWRQAVKAGMQNELSGITIGNLKYSESLQRNKLAQKYTQIVANQGNQLKCLEAAITGARQGQTYRGLVRLIHITSVSNPKLGGVISASCVISPAEQFPQTLQINEQIDNSYEENPAFEQRIQQISQQAMQRANQQHQQRMAQRQAAFNAHQQRMQQNSQAQDASFNNYMNNAQTSYPSAWSNSGYSGQNAIVDQIHERSTFENPDTGYDISLDGQYDYNYTNGLGDYYRTNDPSFDQNSLQGDWQQTEVLSPNY
uniref:Uncharacterized protein n=1 Tax=Roseihalotalea indica TaxID=2867963 RepID=A0AA49Q0D9_9BACT|nr:hypothetical protein K4G66_15440 [Tunicatimonas sp. TK19036]